MSIEFRLKTLTPLWTGGVKGECDRLHETGLIGSLRWWYEVVVRGLGGEACDPVERGVGGGGTGDGKGACDFNVDKYEASRRKNQQPSLASAEKAGLCPVCLIFGTTGWRRIFQLDVDDSALKVVMESPNKGLLLPSGRCHNNRAGGWYILPARCGNFTLRLRFVPGYIDERNVSLFFATLRLMGHWTAIGAKETGGYGVFRVMKAPEYELPGQAPFGQSQEASGGESGSTGLPGLADFFFAKVRFRPKQNSWWQEFEEVKLAIAHTLPCGGSRQQLISGKNLQNWLAAETIPLSPIVRNWLRYTWYRKQEQNLRLKEELVWGTIKDNHRRTAIGISHAYKLEDNLWEFRIWGHRPFGVQKKEWQAFVDILYYVLQFNASSGSKKARAGNPPSVWADPEWVPDSGGWRKNNGGLFGGITYPAGLVWREFNSERDSIDKTSDQWEFFKSLVRGEEMENG